MGPLRVSSRVVLPAFVLLIAAGLRLWGLASPTHLYGDEQYYVFDAAVYMGGGIGDPIGAPSGKIADEARGSTRRSGNGSSPSWASARSDSARSAGGSPRRLFGIGGVPLLYLFASVSGDPSGGQDSPRCSCPSTAYTSSKAGGDARHLLVTFMTAAACSWCWIETGRHRPRSRAAGLTRSRLRLALPSGPESCLAPSPRNGPAPSRCRPARLCAPPGCSRTQAVRALDGRPLATLVASFAAGPRLGIYLVSYSSFFFQHGLRSTTSSNFNQPCSATNRLTTPCSRRTPSLGRGRCSFTPSSTSRLPRATPGHRCARATPRCGGGSSRYFRSGLGSHPPSPHGGTP